MEKLSFMKSIFGAKKVGDRRLESQRGPSPLQAWAGREFLELPIVSPSAPSCECNTLGHQGLLAGLLTVVPLPGSTKPEECTGLAFMPASQTPRGEGPCLLTTASTPHTPPQAPRELLSCGSCTQRHPSQPLVVSGHASHLWVRCLPHGLAKESSRRL